MRCATESGGLAEHLVERDGGVGCSERANDGGGGVGGNFGVLGGGECGGLFGTAVVCVGSLLGVIHCCFCCLLLMADSVGVEGTVGIEVIQQTVRSYYYRVVDAWDTATCYIEGWRRKLPQGY